MLTGILRIPQNAAWVMALLVLVTGCGDGKKAKGPAGPSVVVAHPLQKEIVENDEYSGRLAAVDSVEVRARVSGYLERVAFKAGQIVQKGDLLFVIDQRPFNIAVEQAEADHFVGVARAAVDEVQLNIAA